MPIQCPNCKTLSRDTASFCERCGVRLVASSAQTVLAGSVPRPTTLPEAAAVPASAPRPLPPRVKVGPPRRAGRTAAFVYFLLGVVLVASIVPDVPLEVRIAFGIGAGLCCLPLVLGKMRYSSMGVVTHLRAWVPMGQHPRRNIPEWVLDLRLTDKDWSPLQDRRRFLLPIVEVQFRSDKVFGPALEEGSRIVLHGRVRKDGIVEATAIWNLASGEAAPLCDRNYLFRGRVTGLAARQAQDMRYPGQRALEVWSFRLQCTDTAFAELLRDEQGNPLPALPVEVRAQVISGSLQEGDKLEVQGPLMHGTLYAQAIRNHSAGGAALVLKERAGVP